jgi:hypothetical protein
MTLQQTLTIPKATRHLSVDLPEPIPAGTVVLTFTLMPKATANTKPIDPCLEGAVNPSIRGTVKITGDIIGPFFDEWGKDNC